MYPDNLTVNADDFGIDVNISRGIQNCIERDLVNSISIIPFDNDETEKILDKILTEKSRVKLGCHLSLYDIPEKFSDTQITARSFRQFLWKYLRGKISVSQVYQIWERQIEWLVKKGIKLNHLDSHQHLHVLPGLWNCVRKLQKKYAIPHLRIPYESVTGSIYTRFPFGFFFQILAFFRMKGFSNYRFIGFIKSMHFNYEFYRTVFEKIPQYPERKYELMVHPGYNPENSSNKNVSWAGSWENEINELEKLRNSFQNASDNQDNE